MKKMSLKTQVMNHVSSLPNQMITRKQINELYTLITGKNENTGTINNALSKPYDTTFSGQVYQTGYGYFMKPSKDERRHIQKVKRGLYKLINP